MKSFLLKIFEITLILFSLSVSLTMYSMASMGEERQLWGINYDYYLLPLLFANIIIIIVDLKDLVLKGLNKWILLWGGIASVSALLFGYNNLNTLVRVNIWISTYFAAYCLAKQSSYSIESIVKVFIIIYFLGLFFFWQGKLYQSVNYDKGMEIRSNAIYCIITVVPLILLLKRKWFTLLLLILAFVSTIFSSKRGATIIMILALIPVSRSVFSKMSSKTWRSVFVVLMVVAISYLSLFISNSYLGGVLMDRFADVEESGGSGRMDLWELTIDAFNNSNISNQLFGHGYRAVSYLADATGAHNDFLEILYDYGVIGLVFYLFIHLFMIMKMIRLRKQKNNLFFPFAVMYIIFFVMSMVSILIVQQRYLVYMAVFWGMLEGCNYQYEIKYDNNKISKDEKY